MKSTEPSTAAAPPSASTKGLSGRGAIGPGEGHGCGLHRPNQPARRRWPRCDCGGRAHPPNPSPALQAPQCTAAVATGGPRPGGGSGAADPSAGTSRSRCYVRWGARRLYWAGRESVVLASPEHLLYAYWLADQCSRLLRKTVLPGMENQRPGRTEVHWYSWHSNPERCFLGISRHRGTN